MDRVHSSRSCARELAPTTGDGGTDTRSGQTRPRGSARDTGMATELVPSRLMIWDGDRSYVYPLGPGVTTIGRSTKNMVVLVDEAVSPFHAEIHHTADGYELVDL